MSVTRLDKAIDEEINRLLEGRTAKCGDHGEVPSSVDLAFFEYRGEGSKAATVSCKNCGYRLVAHEQEQQFSPSGSITLHNVVIEGTCPGFEPHGPWDHDLYYCGCRGWD